LLSTIYRSGTISLKKILSPAASSALKNIAMTAAG
jgi:hypothetical protein